MFAFKKRSKNRNIKLNPLKTLSKSLNRKYLILKPHLALKVFEDPQLCFEEFLEHYREDGRAKYLLRAKDLGKSSERVLDVRIATSNLRERSSII